MVPLLATLLILTPGGGKSKSRGRQRLLLSILFLLIALTVILFRENTAHTPIATSSPEAPPVVESPKLPEAAANETDVLVALREIPAGTKLKPEDFTSQPLDVESVPADVVRSYTEVENKVARGVIYPNVPLTRNSLSAE